MRRQRGHALAHLLQRETIQPEQGDAAREWRQIVLLLLQPETLERRRAHDDAERLGIGQDMEDVLDDARHVGLHAHQKISGGEIETAREPLLDARDEERDVPKQSLPVAQVEIRGGRANRDDQFRPRAPVAGTEKLDERPFVLGGSGLLGVE